jgi:hypothetical protein
MSVHFEWVKNKETAERLNPCAVKIVKVEGGYAIFDTWEDYNQWTRQK